MWCCFSAIRSWMLCHVSVACCMAVMDVVSVAWCMVDGTVCEYAACCSARGVSRLDAAL